MSTTYGALCTDFAVNLRLGLKLDLPTGRDTLLGLLDRVRREHPNMSRLRRGRGEISLEAGPDGGGGDWLSLKRTTIRCGSVNPMSLEVAARLHRSILEVAPFYLSISPLDVDSIEVSFVFELLVEAGRREVAFDALTRDTPLGGVVDRRHERILDHLPSVTFAIDDDARFEATIDVRTRATDEGAGPDPGVVILNTSVRHFPVLNRVEMLPALYDDIMARTVGLVDERVIPQVLTPLRDAIHSHPGRGE